MPGPSTSARSGFLLARHTGNLPAELEFDLARRAAAGCARSTDALVRAHLRLVYSAAGDYRSFGVPMDELVAEASLALVIAVRRFDPERNVRLGVYALWWMHAHLRRLTLRLRRISGYPTSRNGRRVLARLRTTQRELTQVNGAPPDAEAIAAELGVKPADVLAVESWLSGHDVAPPSAQDWDRYIPGVEPGPHEDLVRTEKRARVNHALKALPLRERQLLVAHYSDTEISLHALGKKIGVCRERARQLRNRAIEQLGQELQAEGATDA